MARIRQSIEIRVPVHAVYDQLMHFEDYPRFMQEVETVHRLDDTHLHWLARLSYQTMEWDSEIIEQVPNRCIAWRNMGGPLHAGRVELQPVGQDKARVTMTMECDPGLAVMKQRLKDDLARFKALMEARTQQSPSAGLQANRMTQSAPSLSSDDATKDERYSVSEEQNFDQQSDQARRVGQMPLDFGPEQVDASDAMAQAIKRTKPASAP